MTDILVELPIFLPGKEEDFSKHFGVATITDEGVLTFTFSEPAAAKRLVDLATHKVLVAAGFHYIKSYPATSNEENTDG